MYTMRFLEKQSKAQTKILNILLENKFGSSAQLIADEMNITRNTVMKHLEQLKTQKLVYEWNIGRYRIWIHRNFYLYLDELNRPQDYIIYKFTKELFTEIKKNCQLDTQDWKNIGKHLSDRINFQKHFPTEYIANIKEEYAKDPQNLEIMAKLYPFLLKNTLLQLGDAKVTVDPPIVNNNPQFIIFRLRNSIFADNPVFFHILSGIKENELQEFYPKISIVLHEYYPAEKIIDLKYSFD